MVFYELNNKKLTCFPFSITFTAITVRLPVTVYMQNNFDHAYSQSCVGFCFGL